MKINITSEGIDIISKNKDLTIYRTVDEKIVLYATDASYKETFNGNSDDITEKKIYEELSCLIKKVLKNSYNKQVDPTQHIHEGVIKFYHKNKSDILKLQKKGNNVILELKKIKNDDLIPSGKFEIRDKKNEALFLEMFKSLIKDERGIEQNSLQKIKK